MVTKKSIENPQSTQKTEKSAKQIADENNFFKVSFSPFATLIQQALLAYSPANFIRYVYQNSQRRIKTNVLKRARDGAILYEFTKKSSYKFKLIIKQRTAKLQQKARLVRAFQAILSISLRRLNFKDPVRELILSTKELAAYGIITGDRHSARDLDPILPILNGIYLDGEKKYGKEWRKLNENPQEPLFHCTLSKGGGLFVQINSGVNWKDLLSPYGYIDGVFWKGTTRAALCVFPLYQHFNSQKYSKDTTPAKPLYIPLSQIFAAVGLPYFPYLVEQKEQQDGKKIKMYQYKRKYCTISLNEMIDHLMQSKERPNDPRYFNFCFSNSNGVQFDRPNKMPLPDLMKGNLIATPTENLTALFELLKTAADTDAEKDANENK